VECPFALVAQDGRIEDEGVTPLVTLSGLARGRRIVALLAASDVTLLQAKIPPMPAAKLKAALPNLLEDRLLGNPTEWLMVVSDNKLAANQHLIAIAARAWLEKIAQLLRQQGARRIAVLPGQLCLPQQAERVTAAITLQPTGQALTLRTAANAGLGLTLPHAQPEQALQSLAAIVPSKPVDLHVPTGQLPAYQAALSRAGMASRFELLAMTWQLWIAGSQDVTLNLLDGLRTQSRHNIDWKSWRRPLALGALLLIVNIAALNISWWQMSHEADMLRNGLAQSYRAHYPNEPLIIDPVAQMQQKVSAAKRNVGILAADDFIALSAVFGEAWREIPASDKPKINALDYRERALSVTMKTSSSAQEDGLKKLEAALRARQISVSPQHSSAGINVWKIGGAP
jgi:general secretion pathway protein L